MRRPKLVEHAATEIRAAQYVRMSTSEQKYSIGNQAARIAAYAARRNISIVRTYSDPGKSGVQIAGRRGLQDLIRDVQLARADFSCVLVYDVTRWGRFQDVDESAYYEFICKQAGISVHYCEDDFENDGSFASDIVKVNKRAAAADFSKQLSRKVFFGQCNVITLGYWRGGPAGYGLRRMLINEAGKPVQILEYGQRKSLKSQHVILVPGPKAEIRIVQSIFDLFVNKKKSRQAIAEHLNAKKLLNARGNAWTMQTISNTLENEAYIGNLVYNRRSQKLGSKQVSNPPNMWVRRDNTFTPIVRREIFAKAQKRLAELAYGRVLSDKELIGKLRDLRKRYGRLSLKLMMTTPGIPHSTTYRTRFGSLTNAFRLAGYKPEARYCFKETRARTDRWICSAASDIIVDVEGRGRSITFLEELYLLMIGSKFTVSITVAMPVSNGRARGAIERWEAKRIRYYKSDLVLILRLTGDARSIKDYYLLLTAHLPRSTDKRIRISNRVFEQFRYDTFQEVMSALYQKLGISQGRSVRRAARTLPSRLRQPHTVS